MPRTHIATREHASSGLSISATARGRLVLGAALGTPAVLLLYDAFAQTQLLDNSIPEFNGARLLGSALLISLAAALVAWIGGGPRAGAARGETAGAGPVAAVTVGAAAFALLAVSPEAYSWLAREDQLVETFSAAFAFASAGVLLASLPALGRVAQRQRWSYLAPVAAIAVALFGLGGEEISWGQRLLGFHTPESLAGNMQGEANLHNLATDKVEVVYYFGAFAFLILLPFVRECTDAFAEIPAAEFILPRRAALLAAAPMVAFSFNKWALATTQFAFFATIAILGWYLVAERGRRGASRVLTGATLAVCLVAQAGFLLLGDRQARVWDVTEYRELLIPLGFFVYALELRRRVAAAERRVTAPGSGRSAG